MTDEEQKAWDRIVTSRSDPRVVQVSEYDRAILAADAELKRLREDIELLLNYFGINEKFIVNLRSRTKEG